MRKVKCAIAECHAEGTWFPIITLRNKANPYAPAEIQLHLPHCQEHKEGTTLADLATPNFYDSIRESFAKLGLATPTQDLTTLSWTTRLHATLQPPEKPS